jgi:hypothetical protein
MKVLHFLIENWALITSIVLTFVEVVLRWLPTDKNYSILDNILKFIAKIFSIIPNRKPFGGKHILFILFLFVSCSSFSQTNVYPRQIRFIPPGVLYASDTAESNANRGYIWYDQSTHRFRKNENGTNSFLGSGTGGSSYSFTGGLTNNSGVVSIDGVVADGATLAPPNDGLFIIGGGSNTSLELSPTNTLIAGNLLEITADNIEIDPNSIPTATSDHVLYFNSVTGAITSNTAPGSNTYSNGLTLTGSNVELGGELTETTTIYGEAYNLRLGHATGGPGKLDGLYAETNDGFDFLVNNNPSGYIGRMQLSSQLQVFAISGMLLNSYNDDMPATSSLFSMEKLSTTNDAPSLLQTWAVDGYLGAVNGLGVYNTYNIQNSGGTNAEAARETVTLTDVTAGSVDGTYSLSVSVNNTPTEYLNVSNNYVYTGGIPISIQSLVSASTSTAGGTITLDFQNSINSKTVNSVQKIFIGSATFSSTKTMAFGNTGNALSFDFHFEVTNVAGTLVWPSNVVMADINFDTSTQTWTPPSTGQYEASGTYDGANWKVKISGPYN